MAPRYIAILASAAAGTLFASSSTNHAQADPYRWCAHYGYSDDGGTNCYFVTLQQCQAAISGNGGLCTPNLFYDGRPVITPGEGPRRSRTPILQ